MPALADCEVITGALLERLQSQHDLEDQKYLITATVHARPWKEAGVTRIGTWIVHADGDNWELRFRMPWGPVAARLYTASVMREGGAWKVGEVFAGEVRRR